MKYKKGHLGYWLDKKRPPISEKTREKLKRSHIGKKPTLGKHWAMSDEGKENIRKSLVGVKHKPMSDIGRKNISNAQKGKKKPWKAGKNNHFWGGGVALENDVLRKSLEFKLWREAVFDRDNYTCVFCGIRGGELHPDHIKPFSLFPELRFAIDNGRTLCKSCHMKTDTWGCNAKYLRREFNL